MGNHQMFYGDRRASDPVPLNFLKARKVKFKGLTDEERIESVLNHLATNLEVEVWYYALNAMKRKDWKLFEAAFEANWLWKTVVMITLVEKRAKLTKERLEAKDVLKLTMVNGVEMMGWAIWIGKVRQLSAQAKDMEGALIGVVYENLPDILKKHMKPEYKDWDEFIKEAQDVKESDIWQSLKEDNRIIALEQQLSEQLQHQFITPSASRPPLAPTLPTTPLQAMMSNFVVSHPSVVSQPSNPTSQSNNPFLQGGTMSLTNLFAGYSAQHRPPAKRMSDLTTNTRGKLHHANTALGQSTYEANKAEWIHIHSSKWGLDETCPYPLTPGTEPVGRGGCYKCGHLHLLFNGTPCPHPAVDPHELSTGELLGKSSGKVVMQPILPHTPHLLLPQMLHQSRNWCQVNPSNLCLRWMDIPYTTSSSPHRTSREMVKDPQHKLNPSGPRK